jgi:transcription antitermination factor NusG
VSCYAIQVIGGDRAAREVQLACMDAGYFARIPRCTITQRAIFPGYVFLTISAHICRPVSEASLARALERIRVAPHVDAAIAHVLGHVSAAELRAIDAIERFAAFAAVPIDLNGIEHGDPIEITSGPMAGHRATFVRGLRRGVGPHSRWMLIVELSILGRPCVVDLNPESARRVRQSARRDRKLQPAVSGRKRR